MSRVRPGCAHARLLPAMTPSTKEQPRASRKPQAQPGSTICNDGKSQPPNRRAADLSRPSGQSGHPADDGVILPGQLLEADLQRGNPLPMPAASPAGKPASNVVCRPQTGCLLLYFPAGSRGPSVRILLLTCGAKGTRTPDPLLAKHGQDVQH